MGTALLLGSDCAARSSARAALARAGWTLLEGSSATGADAAEAFDSLASAEAPRLLVFVVDMPGDAPLLDLTPARLRALEEGALIAPWEALRDGSRALVTQASTVLLVAPVADGSDVLGVFALAARRALRIMVAAAAVELASREWPIRVNLLEYDAGQFDAPAYEHAVAFLASPASGFVTGTHLALPGAADKPAARAR